MRLVRRRGRVVLLALAGAVFACAHGPKGAESGAVVAGRYAVESIRSRATLNGEEQLLEISEAGNRVVDASGVEHLLTERGALLLSAGGACRLALAVSVDGEEPGISDRSCTWSIEGDQFFLGDGRSDLRTVYRVQRSEGRLVLEGLVDVAPDGRVIGDAAGERIVLVEAPARSPERRRASRTAEPASATEPLHADDI
jgi:hypothetical protein